MSNLTNKSKLETKRTKGLLQEEKSIPSNRYKAEEEIAGYDTAMVLYLSNTNNLPDKVKWIKAIASESNCSARMMADNMVIVISNNENGNGRELKDFKRNMEL